MKRTFESLALASALTLAAGSALSLEYDGNEIVDLYDSYGVGYDTDYGDDWYYDYYDYGYDDDGYYDYYSDYDYDTDLFDWEEDGLFE